MEFKSSLAYLKEMGSNFSLIFYIGYMVSECTPLWLNALRQSAHNCTNMTWCSGSFYPDFFPLMNTTHRKFKTVCGFHVSIGQDALECWEDIYQESF